MKPRNQGLAMCTTNERRNYSARQSFVGWLQLHGLLLVAVDVVMGIGIAGCDSDNSQDRTIALKSLKEWVETGQYLSPDKDVVVQIRISHPSVEEWYGLTACFQNGDSEVEQRAIGAICAILLDDYDDVDYELSVALLSEIQRRPKILNSLFRAYIVQHLTNPSDIADLDRSGDRYLRRLVRSIGQSRASVRGKSYAGVILLASALERPDWIESAVVSGPVAAITVVQEEIFTNGDFYRYDPIGRRYFRDIEKLGRREPVVIQDQEPLAPAYYGKDLSSYSVGAAEIEPIPAP